MTSQNKPFLVNFCNQKDAHTFDVVVNHERCDVATAWTKDFFGLLRVDYVCSDFDGNHTFNCRPKAAR